MIEPVKLSDLNCGIKVAVITDFKIYWGFIYGKTKNWLLIDETKERRGSPVLIRTRHIVKKGGYTTYHQQNPVRLLQCPECGATRRSSSISGEAGKLHCLRCKMYFPTKFKEEINAPA